MTSPWNNAVSLAGNQLSRLARLWIVHPPPAMPRIARLCVRPLAHLEANLSFDEAVGIKHWRTGSSPVRPYPRQYLPCCQPACGRTATESRKWILCPERLRREYLRGGNG